MLRFFELSRKLNDRKVTIVEAREFSLLSAHLKPIEILKIEGKEYRLHERLGTNALIVVGRDNCFYQVILNKAKPKLLSLSPSCASICGHDLRRWHYTCLFTCRLRREKLPVFKVWQYQLWVKDQRRFGRVKAFLLKNLLSVCESLSN